MIEVEILSQHSFTLKGDCINPHAEQTSTISLFPSGWAVTLYVSPYPLQHKRQLKEEQIIETLTTQLHNIWQDEKINTEQIREFIQHVKALYQKNPNLF